MVKNKKREKKADVAPEIDDVIVAEKEIVEEIPEEAPQTEVLKEEPQAEVQKVKNIAKFDINPKIRKGDIVPEEMIARWKESKIDLDERLE